MKIIVLCQDYPSLKNKYAMSYVHSRNIIYKKLGHDVTVLNFSTLEKYEYENIEVLPENLVSINDFDIILSHAPNLKNHYRYLKRVKERRIVFFFHGHEVLRGYKDYPKPYRWVKNNIFKGLIADFYQKIKLKVLRIWFTGDFCEKNQVGMIFVSDWMLNKFVKNLKFDPKGYVKVKIIPNAVNPVFIEKEYEVNNVVADFVTIRPFDEAKYAVDLVVNLAKKNPNKKFHLYGKGEYFNHNVCPENLKIINEFIEQKDIPELLNKYKYALMPTRFDSQGVMMCEMATYGIPLITTDFEVCLEMLKGFDNTLCLNEELFSKEILWGIENRVVNKNMKFDPQVLINEEVSFFEGI